MVNRICCLELLVALTENEIKLASGDIRMCYKYAEYLRATQAMRQEPPEARV